MPATQSPTRSALYTVTARKLARLAERIEGRGSRADDAIYAKVAPLRPVVTVLNAAFDCSTRSIKEIEDQFSEMDFSPALYAAIEEEFAAARAQDAKDATARAAREAQAARDVAERAAWRDTHARANGLF
jgi:hypothetical protein